MPALPVKPTRTWPACLSKTLHHSARNLAVSASSAFSWEQLSGYNQVVELIQLKKIKKMNLKMAVMALNHIETAGAVNGIFSGCWFRAMTSCRDFGLRLLHAWLNFKIISVNCRTQMYSVLCSREHVNSPPVLRSYCALPSTFCSRSLWYVDRAKTTL